MLDSEPDPKLPAIRSLNASMFMVDSWLVFTVLPIDTLLSPVIDSVSSLSTDVESSPIKFRETKSFLVSIMMFEA